MREEKGATDPTCSLTEMKKRRYDRKEDTWLCVVTVVL